MIILKILKNIKLYLKFIQRGTREITQLVECLPCKHEDHDKSKAKHKTMSLVVSNYDSSTREAETERSPRLTASQPRLHGKPQVSEKLILKNSTERD